MSDRRRGSYQPRHPGVIIRPGQTDVFSDLILPGGESMKVMSQEVYNRAVRAAGLEISKAVKQSVSSAELPGGKPGNGLR